MPLSRIAILSIPVSDQQGAKAFYVDILGFQVKRENPMGPDQTWVELEIPNTDTSITLVNWFDAMPPGGVQGLVLDTPDIEQMKNELAGKGIDVPDIQETPWGRYFLLQDPDGNGLVLQQAL